MSTRATSVAVVGRDAPLWIAAAAIQRSLGHLGVSVRAIDLSYFDDWCMAIANGEQYLPMSDYFIPMWRVERITRDSGSDSTPSMSDLFEQRTGHRMDEFQIT